MIKLQQTDELQWFQNTITKNTKESFEKPIKLIKC